MRIFVERMRIFYAHLGYKNVIKTLLSHCPTKKKVIFLESFAISFVEENKLKYLCKNHTLILTIKNYCMAKKKDSESLVDLLNEWMSSMEPEEREATLQLLSSAQAQQEVDLSQYYHHQCPDYRQIVQPIAPYLMPLWEMEELDDYSPVELYEACSIIPKKDLERDIRNFVFHLFAKYGRAPIDSCDYQLWYALALMEHYRLEHCLDVVLEVLRQDLPFLDYCFGLMHDNLLAAIIYRLGKKQLPVLMEFMKEPGLLPIVKYRVVEAVAHIIITTPARRVEVLAWFCKLLNYYFEVLADKDNDICPVMLVDHIAACMMDTRGIETLPILEKIYHTYNIIPFGIPSLEEMKKKMPHTELHGLEIDSVEECLDEYVADYFDTCMDEFDDYEDVEEELETEPLYMEGKPAKKLQIKIELEDTNPLVWRTLEVASNMCLERFSEVVEEAMGWDSYHLHQFVNKNGCYMPPEKQDELGLEFPSDDIFDSTQISVGELFAGEGSSFRYEYDFGDSWMHKITLLSQENYKKGEEPSIVLLDGANACPPEDCGGVLGYQKMLEALKKPRSKEARRYKDWLGYDFDPNEFDLEETRNFLADIV